LQLAALHNAFRFAKDFFSPGIHNQLFFLENL